MYYIFEFKSKIQKTSHKYSLAHLCGLSGNSSSCAIAKATNSSSISKQTFFNDPLILPNYTAKCIPLTTKKSRKSNELSCDYLQCRPYLNCISHCHGILTSTKQQRRHEYSRSTRYTRLSFCTCGNIMHVEFPVYLIGQHLWECVCVYIYIQIIISATKRKELHNCCII